MKKKVRRQHAEEFKKEAVRLARESGKPITQVARDLRISDSLLHAWISKYRDAESRGKTVEDIKREQDELNELRRELRRLREENEILKKAAAYFAKESM